MCRVEIVNQPVLIINIAVLRAVRAVLLRVRYRRRIVLLGQDQGIYLYIIFIFDWSFEIPQQLIHH